MLLLDASKTHSFLCNALLVIPEQGNYTLDLFGLLWRVFETELDAARRTPVKCIVFVSRSRNSFLGSASSSTELVYELLLAAGVSYLL